MQGEMITDERAKLLLEAFEKDQKEDDRIVRDEKDEIAIHISYARGMRNMAAFVNVRENYLATEDGSTFHLSGEFCGYVKEYYDTGSLMGVRTIEVQEGGGTDEGISD